MLSAIAIAAVLAAAPEVLNPWTDPLPADDALRRYVQKLHQDKLQLLAPEAQAVVEKKLDELDKHPRGATVFAAEQTSALLEATGYTPVASAFAGWAAMKVPQDAVALGNFGALWCDPLLLRAALARDPRSAVLLTTLGSCAMSAQQWALAKGYYEQALRLAPNHTNALLGLAQLCMHEGDLQRAMGLYAKAGGVAIRRQPQLAEQKDDKGKVLAPPEPYEAGPSRFGGGGGGGAETAHVTDGQLSFPPLPQWPGPDAFIKSQQGRKDLGKFYGEKWASALKLLKKVEQNPLKSIGAETRRVKGMSKAERDDAEREQAAHPSWDDRASFAALSANYAWASKELDDLEARYKEAIERMKPVQKALEDEANTRNVRFAAICPEHNSGELIGAKECVEHAREELVGSCNSSMALNGKLFAIYNAAYHEWYAKATPILERLYRVQGEWIRQISNDAAYDLAVQQRDSMVFGPIAATMQQERTMAMVFASIGLASFGVSAQVCPRAAPPGTWDAPPAQPPKVSKPERECPLDKNPAKIPPFTIPFIKCPLSFVVTCKEAEMKLSFGIGGDDDNPLRTAEASALLSIKHRFGSDKSTTIFLGVAGNVGHDAGIGKASINGEVGVVLTSDRHGNITDIGGRATATESHSIMPVSEALEINGYDSSTSIAAAIEKGAPTIDVETSHSRGLEEKLKEARDFLK